MATTEASTREIVVRTDRRTSPRATASITLLTPCGGASRNQANVPAANPTIMGIVNRNQAGRPVMALTTFSAP